MKASQRHEWVKIFIEALLDAPKNLWHPLLVIVDEAHLYAPEKGAGESVASDAMIGLATRGRKRGFCAVFATQRLGKLRKDAAAELTNVLIGQTFIDVDRKRAAETLGIPKSDERSFFDEMKVIEPGNFYALGRAITKERTLTRIGEVSTTHNEPGEASFSSEPPPVPAKIKSLLPKLSELPKEAEQKARTEAELRAEVASLRRELSIRPTVSVPETKIERVEVPALSPDDLSSIADLVLSMNTIAGGIMDAAKGIQSALHKANTPAPIVRAPYGINPPAQISSSRLTVPETVRKMPTSELVKIAGGLSSSQQKILNSLAWLESVRIYTPKRTVTAFLSGQSSKSSTFKNNLSFLRGYGAIEYAGGDALSLTDYGREVAKKYEAPGTSEDLQAAILDKLPRPQAAILGVLISYYPNVVRREDCAEYTQQSPKSSTFKNNLSALRSLGVIDYAGADGVKALPILFLE